MSATKECLFSGFKIKNRDFDGVLIYGGDVDELKRVDVNDAGVTVGGGCTLHEFETKLSDLEKHVQEGE